MSAFSLPDRRAGLAALLLAASSAWFSTADARVVRHIQVSTSSADSLGRGQEVTGVTINGEGIRIQGGSRTIHVARDPNVDIDIDVDDSSLKAMGYGHRGSGDIVQMFQDVHVPKDMVVDGDVVSIFGSVDVQGRVAGQVVAVFGNVTAADSSHIGGDVVTVGGTLHTAPTAEIGGQSVSAPVFGPPRVARWLPGAAMIASVFFFALLGALLALLFPDRLVRVAHTISRRTFMSFLLGLLAFPALPVLLVVLCITVVGIPVAVLLLVLFPVAMFVGYVASCVLMGARLSGGDILRFPVWRSAILGLVFVGVFFVLGGILTNLSGGGFLRVLGFSFMALGVLIGSISSLLGLGALVLSRLGEPERGITPSGTPAPPPGIPATYAPPTT